MKTETEILREIQTALQDIGYHCWRMPLGGVKHGGRRKTHPLAGFPDLFGLLKKRRGVMYAIEVKTPTGKLSDKQVEWASQLSTAGAACSIITSAEDAVEWIRGIDRICSQR